MLTTYLNTNEYVFLDADGNSFPDGSPALSVGGKEEVHIFLKKETPNWGAASARPADWPADTSWGSIPGISAMLTVDDDYRKFLPGTVKNAVAAGAASVTCSISDTEDIPVKGIIRLFSATSDIESVYYSGRSVSDTTVIFDLETTVKGEYPAGSAIDCTAAPLAQAYLAAGKSNWTTGELVFDLVLDSERLRAGNDFKNKKSVTIQGVELLLYSINNGIVQILRAFLMDTASLNNVQGNPGFTAPLPDQMRDTMAAEVSRQVEALADSVTPSISAAETWVINGVDTGKPSRGRQGPAGKNGKDGHTPARGTDYWTESDIAEIKAYVDDAILNGAW